MKFIPKYITTDILADYGEHLTHEAYNEMVLLNSTQGDYNTKILNQLFNTDEGIQIPYLDKKIKEVTDDQAAINEDMEQVVADMAALAGSLSKYSTILETRRMIQYATQDFVKTNKIKAGENVEVEVDALNNVIISATGGGGDVTQEYVDEHDASTLDAANNYTDNAIDNIDLDDYATKDYVDDAIADIPIPVVPTDISAFNNDVGYITDYTETDPVFSASAAAGITSQDITDWNNKSDFSGDYGDLTNKPTIPTNTSDLNNDSGFISSESDPVFSASPAAGITAQDINNWNNAGGLVNLLDGNATGSLRGVDTLDDADPDYPTYAIGQDAVALGYGTRAEGASSFAGGSGAWAESYNDFAFGSGAHASGGQSVAFGSGSTASGSGSFALGNGATASGSTAVSMGQGSTVAGSSSFGLGTSNTVNANAFASAAIGLSNTISGGQGSIALGYGNTSSSFGSVAEGLQTTASDSGAHAEGGHTTASGSYSHAEGQYTVASGTNAHAEGQYTEAGTMQHAEGYYNLVENLPIIHMVGNGNSSVRSNAYTLDQMGNGWFSGNVYVGSTSGTHKDAGSERLASFSETVHYIDLDTNSSNPIILDDLEPGVYINSNINKINEKCYTKGTTSQTTAAYINQPTSNFTVLYFKVLTSFADAAINDNVAEFYGYQREASLYKTGSTGGEDIVYINYFKAVFTKTNSTTVTTNGNSSGPYFSISEHRTASMPDATTQSSPDATHPNVIQYIGETDNNYTQGEFYKLVRPAGGTMADQYWQSLGITSGGAAWGSITGTLTNQTDLVSALSLAPIPTIADAHWTDAAREFIFADKPVGTYLVHNGSTDPTYDITSRTNMSFRASTATSTRVTVTAQWGIIYIIKPYNDAATDEVFGYALFANGQTDGTMEFRLQSITRLSSGYRVSFNNIMVTNNNSPIKKMIRLYNSSSTYNVDDLVLNTDGWFYRCTTAITTPESFNSAHWSNFNGYGIDKYIKELIASVAPPSLNLAAGTYSSNVIEQGIRMLANPGYASCVSSGLHSVAFGTLSQATSRESMAMGYDAQATGQGSFACGDRTRAKGQYSFAEGQGTIANNKQHASGYYNIEKASNTNMLSIVGNGTADNARSNAYTLDSSGNAWFAGDVYVGSTSGTDKDSGSVKLAKESQLPNITYTDTDPGAGSTLADGAIVLVYE